jgi:hypothetical protein
MRNGRLSRLDQTHFSEFSQVVLNICECLLRIHRVAGSDPICQFFSGTPFREKEPQLPTERIEHVDGFEIPGTPADGDHNRFAGDIAGNDGRVSDMEYPFRVYRHWLVFRPPGSCTGTRHGT